MTMQMSDRILCDYPNFELDGLRLYRVIRGDIHSNYGWGEPYLYIHQPNPPEKPMSSALHRGYISTYELRPDGSVYLVSYEYPHTRQDSECFEEKLEGDFWLVMKADFNAERIYIPFVDSVIITDRRQWECEPPKILENKP